MTQTPHTRVPDSLSIDTVVDLLGHSHRRQAVAVLADRGSAMALRSLARAVAFRDPDDDPPTTDALATALHHVHLPKLAAADVVDYDHEAKVVVPRDVVTLAACMDAARGSRQSDAVSVN